MIQTGLLFSCGRSGSPLFLSVVTIPLLLWYARRASRFSVAHAYFLVFIAGGITLPYFLAEELPIYARELLKLAGGVLAVWLLANFDLRSPAFRRLAAIVVVALNGLLYLSLSVSAVLLETVLFAVLAFWLPLLLVYLVRVRHPAPAADAPSAPPSEVR